MAIKWFGETTLTELTLLMIAFVLSAAIGLERGRKLKSAGLRTHTLVGLGSAVFTLVSAYGFATAVGPDVVIDPTRVAAQIVSGIGFLGAGVIFVHRGAVSGLTTAASIWVTASVGMACGAGAPALAGMATVLYLLTVAVLGRLGRRLAGSGHQLNVRLRYREGHGVLRRALAIAAEVGIDVVVTSTRDAGTPGKPRHETTVRIDRPQGRPVEALMEAWADLPGAIRVSPVDPGD